MLRSRNRHHALVKIDMFPSKPELFGFSQPGIERERHDGPLRFADFLPQSCFFINGQEPHPLIIFLKELDGPNGIRFRIPIGNRDIVEMLEERKLAIHTRRSNFSDSLGHVTLDVTRENLPERSAGEDALPQGAVARIIAIGAKAIFDADQIIVDRSGKRYVTASEAFREEAPLLNFGLALLVNLERKLFGADLLAMEPAILIRITNPPDVGFGNPLKNAAVAAFKSGRFF